MTRRSRPGGVCPYAPLRISTSVPQTPIAIVSTSSMSGALSGSGISSSRALSGVPGIVVMARILSASSLRGGLIGGKGLRQVASGR